MWAPICDLGKEKEIKSMKIKRKVQKTLPQLIEWVEKNGIRNHVFISDIARNEVEINIHGCIFCKYITLKDIFTVEVEEVVDEDTKLPKSLAIFEHNGKLYSEMHGNKNINDILKMDIKVKSSSTKTIHMVNDDGTHTLIWRDGKLVE